MILVISSIICYWDAMIFFSASIENIYVQQLNKNNVKLRIKFLGKINKLIDQLKIQNIILQIKNEEWEIKIL